MALPLLAACGQPALTPGPATAPTAKPAGQTAPTGQAAPGATSAPTTAPAAAQATAPAVVPPKPAGVALGQLPAYVPIQGLPTPDLPGTPDGLVSPAYLTYPKDKLFQSVKDPPGRGGEVHISLQTANPPWPPVDQNPAWQAVNKAANVKFNVTTLPFGDFNAKWATLQAGNEHPDMMCTITRPDVAIVPAFLTSRCQDLTPYLAGDAARDYPNLAALPTRAWKSTLIDGKIYGVPIPLRPYFWWFWGHQEILDQMGLKHPTSAAEFKEVATKVNNPQQNTWAIGGNGGSQYAFDTVQGLWNAVFGAPNYWAVDGSGKFTYIFESPEYREAMVYAADLVKAGVYHPNTVSFNVNTGRTEFRGRRMIFRMDGLMNQGGAYWGGTNAPPMDPPSRIEMMPPFSADGQAKPVYYFGRPNFGMALVKKAEDARVREMLRLLNFFASPFGSIESHLLRYGVEGVDFNYDERGNPQHTDTGRAEILPWGSLTSSTGTGGGGEVWYSPQESQSVQRYQSYEKLLAPLGVEDASIGTFSPTFAARGSIMLEDVGGGAQDIIAGRRALSEWDGIVSAWRTGGGQQVKDELAKSYEQLMRG
jgi:putative aldouronate transport system substrate-binding protein